MSLVNYYCKKCESDAVRTYPSLYGTNGTRRKRQQQELKLRPSHGSRVSSAADLETELDADAACIILEDYYKELGEDGEVIVLEDEAVERECAEIYVRNLGLQEEQRRRMMEEREKGRNARQEMIARAKALEESANKDGLNQQKKKKKKKKK